MREGFKKAIVQLGLDPNFVILTGDHGYTLFDDFRKLYPDKFINVGVAETNLATIASGLARAGFKPLIYGLASFVPTRVFEFLKMQVALPELPVTVVGDGAGLVYSQLGHSHQSLEDLSLMTSLSGFCVYSPSSDLEAMTVLISSSDGPKYVRLGKSGGSFRGGFPNDEVRPYRIFGGGNNKVAVLAHGAMTSKTLELAEAEEIKSVDLYSFPTISPLKKEWLNVLGSYNCVIVVEEHIAAGGLGSAILHSLSGLTTKVMLLTASESFHSKIGSYEWTLKARNLSSEAIAQKINQILLAQGSS